MTRDVRRSRPTPEWRGKKRSCTDLLCLFLFFIFMICWIGVGYFAIKKGNFDAIFKPKDSNGRKCGIDNDVLDKPILAFFDLSKCVNLNLKFKCNTPQVCVKECPSENWIFDKNKSNIDDIRKHIICKNNINVSKIQTIEAYEKLIKEDSCASWYLKSKPILRRCIPDGKIPKEIVDQTIKDTALKHVQSVIGKSGKIFDKIINTKWQLLSIMVGSVTLCLFTIVVLQWIALPCVCLSITVLVGALGYLSYHSFKQSKNEYSDHHKYWLCLAIAAGVIGAIIALLTCCLFDRVRLACKIIKEASKAVMSTISSLFFPIFPYILYTIIAVYMFLIFVQLYSIDEEFKIQIRKNDGKSCICSNGINDTSGALCSPYEFKQNCLENGKECLSKRCVSMEPWYIPYFYGINLIGAIWLLCFISAVGQLILASTFSSWYWTFYKDELDFFILLNGIWITFRYHLGTAAFGSFIITIVRCIRYFLTFLQKKALSSENPAEGFFKVCCCCAQCCLSMLERLLKFITMNAYIMCAIYGKGLCTSASNGLALLARNIARTVVLNNVVGCILFVGKVLITLVVSGLTWWYFSKDPHFDNEDFISWVPILVVFLGTYFVADMFFDVYEMAIDTIFLCYLQDCEINDGSQEKPYFMTTGLAKLFKH